MQGGWRRHQVLDGDFIERPAEGTMAAEPFVDENAKGILIAGKAGFATHLFRSHVEDGAGCLLRLLNTSTLGKDSQAKIAEQHFVVSAEQHILWLDIAVDHLFLVGILQGGSE